MKVFYIYLIVVNFITFFAFGIDKQKAKNGAWRIPEKTLLGLCVIGGAYGGFLGMYTFHHKTKKAYFKYPILLLEVAWGVILFLL